MMLSETINKVFQAEVKKGENKTNYIQLNKYKIDTTAYKNLRQVIYYILSEELNTYLEENQQVNEGFIKIQEQLIDSKISFKDIYTTLNWFNSELVRHPKSPFYFDTSIIKPEFKDVLDKMHSVNALVVCAHPFAYDRQENSQEEYIKELINHIEGVDGIEAYYSYGNESIEEKIDIIKHYCDEKDIFFETGGTDYHNLLDDVGILKNGKRIYSTQIDKKMIEKAISIGEFEKQYLEQYYRKEPDGIEI